MFFPPLPRECRDRDAQILFGNCGLVFDGANRDASVRLRRVVRRNSRFARSIRGILT